MQTSESTMGRMMHAGFYSCLLNRPPALPSIPAVGYCDEWRGEPTTGQYQPQMVRLQIQDRLQGPII